MRSSVREVADALCHRLLTANPFEPTNVQRDYDALLPGVSEADDNALRADLLQLAERGRSLRAGTPADEVTLAVIADTCRREQFRLDIRAGDHTVTPMAYSGPPILFGRLARTSLLDVRAATDYLQRIRASGDWIDEVTDRLRVGAAHGRVPVRSLLERTIAWADGHIAAGLPQPVVDPTPPAGWSGADAWRADLEAATRDRLVPALARWRAALAELTASARPDSDAGLSFLPGGRDDYLKAIEVNTTLPLTPEEVHTWGVSEVERFERRAEALGATIGLSDAAAVRDAVRASAFELEPEESMRLAQDAIRRAESWAAQAFRPPLPPPCTVVAMPHALASVGMAPLYSPPRPDSDTPGRYLYNTAQPGIGSGWDREVVALHEGVPGHHLQIARWIADPDMPLLQQLYVPAAQEGWGLYAETLAGEAGLYSDVRAEIGAVHTALLRAARLVVDTGLHAFQWSRDRAVAYLVDHVGAPEPMLHAQIDRYIACPGIALSYAVGQREILRLRDDARSAHGDRFDVTAFHDAVLSPGTAPLPVLRNVVERWVRTPAGERSTRSRISPRS